jgi:hypothetical protein
MKEIEAMSILELLDAVDDSALRREMKVFVDACEMFDRKLGETFRSLRNIEKHYGYALDVTDELRALHSVMHDVRRKQRDALEQIATLDERSALAV